MRNQKILLFEQPFDHEFFVKCSVEQDALSLFLHKPQIVLIVGKQETCCLHCQSFDDKVAHVVRLSSSLTGIQEQRYRSKTSSQLVFASLSHVEAVLPAISKLIAALEPESCPVGLLHNSI